MTFARSMIDEKIKQAQRPLSSLLFARIKAEPNTAAFNDFRELVNEVINDCRALEVKVHTLESLSEGLYKFEINAASSEDA